MIRKLALGATTLALVFGGMATGIGAGVAQAAAPPVNATGTANCSVTGKIKASPALAIPGTGAPSVLTTKVTITGCTGTSGVLSGKGTFTSNVPTDNCTALATTNPLSASGTIKWKGAVKLNPSTVTFSNSSSTVADPITTNSPGAGTSTITGSFSGQQAIAQYVLDTHVADLTAACLGKGIKKLAFTGAQGASTFNITL